MPPRSRTPRTIAAMAVLAALTITGCTQGDPTPSPDGSTGGASTSISASPTAPALQDRSAEVVGGAAPLTQIATTKGKASSTFAGATFTIYQLTTTDTSTLLVFRVTGGGDSNTNDANVRSWENYPILLTGGKEYSVVTFDKQNSGWSAVSNPILKLDDGEQAPPQSVLYPPLPDDTTTLTLKGQWFEDVTVPVTAM